jgi:hypothetical protein
MASAEYYRLKGDYKGAYESYVKFSQIKDSLMNQANTEQLVKRGMNYEFEKKESMLVAEQEKQQALAEEKHRRQNAIIISVGAGLLLTLVLIVIIFRSLQQNKRKSKIIEEQKAVVEEKQKEILDSIYYAKRIQHSLLTPERYISRSLTNLKKINKQ